MALEFHKFLSAVVTCDTLSAVWVDNALDVELYEDFNILKESLSSKDGIPLLFIKLYLQNAKKTIKITNTAIRTFSAFDVPA